MTLGSASIPMATRIKQGEKIMKRLFLGIGLLGLLCMAVPARADEGKIDLKQVKYDELTKLIANQKGKVVVVDFWADN